MISNQPMSLQFNSSTGRSASIKTGEKKKAKDIIHYSNS
jgi:hypothetical protein